MPDLSTDHSSATLEGAHSHGGPRYVSSRADRPISFDPADIPVPRGREEEWRFTPMKRFAPLFDLDTVRAATAAGEADADVAAVRIETDLPEGARLETVPRSDPRIGTVGAPVDRTGVIAWNAAETGTVLTVEAGVQLERPRGWPSSARTRSSRAPRPSTFSSPPSPVPREPSCSITSAPQP